ncbi:MAG: hypothetical protein WCB12_14690 [Bryobacteraceae bacterium]
MNLQLLGNLIRLRYRLIWAKTRSRGGKIALFMSGYLLLIAVMGLLAAGGLGAGVVAVREGKATEIAAIALFAIYLCATIGTVILGFGMNTIFAESEMRRYPLRARERELARHIVAMLDPYWYLVLGLELGLLAGLYLYGAGWFWLGALAVLLLYVCNYVTARLLSTIVERLVARRGGATLLMAVIMALSLGPSLLMPYLNTHLGAAMPYLVLAKWTPPYGAALAMTHADLSAVRGLALIVAWTVLLGAAMVALERRPARVRSAPSGKLRWGSRYDRVGAFLGPQNAILIGQWLRFFSRNNRFRMMYPLSLPLVGFMIYAFTREPGVAPGAKGEFAAAMGAFAIVGFIGTAQFAVNQFGYVGNGLRRYLLLPADPAVALRSCSYTFALLDAVLIVVGLAAWPFLSRGRFDPLMLPLLAGCSLTGMFLYLAVGLWASLLAARRGNYYSSFGNDLSFAGNVILIGGMLSLVFLPGLAARRWPDLFRTGYWWVTLAAAALAAAIYRVSLDRAAWWFRARRERLVAIMEGRS